MLHITIVGAGVHGTRMASIYRKFPHVTLRAVISNHVPIQSEWKAISACTSAKVWRSRFGKPKESDVFDIHVHVGALLDVVRDLAKIGAKKIILPKPIALTAKDLADLQRLVKRYKLDVLVASQWHYASITKEFACFIRENKRQVADITINFSGRFEGVRGTRYSPMTAFLPHVLQIMYDAGISLADLEAEEFSDERIILRSATSHIRVVTDLRSSTREQTIQVHVGNHPEPILVANFSLQKSADGVTTYPSITEREVQQEFREDVLEKMTSKTLDYFTGRRGTSVLSLENYLPVAQALIEIRERATGTVAVVGGGIFGVVSALEIAKRGHRVIIFEKESDILTQASLVNQCRVHMGYHYPRDLQTARDTLASKKAFEKAFAPAIRKIDNFYMVARHGSATSADAYTTFCKKARLPYEKLWPQDVHIQKEHIEESFQIPERIFDARKIRDILWKRLRSSSRCTVVPSTEITRINPLRSGFDLHYKKGSNESRLHVGAVVNASYASLNHINESAGFPPAPYRYDLCEEILVRAPWKNTGWAILDGPFFGAIPFGFAREHVLYDVELSILERQASTSPAFKHTIAYYDTAPRRRERFKRLQKKWAHIVPEINVCKYVSSIYTVRVVLPMVEKTDARPTIIDQLAPGFWQIFSGKITTCVPNAITLAKELHQFLESLET